MSWIALARWLGISCLGVLVALRFISPSFDFYAVLPWAMAFTWPFLLGSAILGDRVGGPTGPQSVWGVLLLNTTLFVGVATMLALGLPVTAENIGPEMASGSMVAIAAVIFTCVGWWRVFRLAQPELSGEAHVVRRWLFIAGCLAILTALALSIAGS